jgi:hypothetical protein
MLTAHLLTALATLLAAAAAQTYQVSYFTDGHCGNYNIGFNPWPNGCYNYGYHGTQSAALVAFPLGNGCESACTFFSEYDCTGNAVYMQQGFDNCAHTIGQYRSVVCTSNYACGNI